MAVSFAALKANYPLMAKAQFYQSLAGQWPTLVNDPNYNNTCATRMSVALTKSGVPILPQYKEGMTGAGDALIIKVKTMGDFMNSMFGPSYWGISKQVGANVAIPNTTGIIAYHVAWSDATGHFDLWTGQGFVGSGNLSDVKDGFDIELWQLV